MLQVVLLKTLPMNILTTAEDINSKCKVSAMEENFQTLCCCCHLIFTCVNLYTVSLDTHSQGVFVCFYISPARQLQPQGKNNRPTQSGVYQNPLDQAPIHTHTHQTGSLNTFLSLFFFFFLPCSQSCRRIQTSPDIQYRRQTSSQKTHKHIFIVSAAQIQIHTLLYDWRPPGDPARAAGLGAETSER